ncbi:MAG TPA: hypothetical protein VJL81_14815 [Solirubrobacterales bacterium]|nr:hypothetical protein [Solirubrobacterales bacterium]
MTTSPSSSAQAPANSLTPTLLGEAEPEDIIVIESFPFAAGSLSDPVTSKVEHGTKNPGFEIKVFNGADCPGSSVATGTAETLEESGIPLTVIADSSTTFSAIQVDPAHPAEPSECSNPLIYWEGNVAVGGPGGGPEGGGTQASGGSSSGGSIGPATPAGEKPEAPRIHTNPGGRANDTTPFVLGNAPGATTVAVYASANCSGPPVAKGTPGELSAGFQVSVVPNAETAFSAVSIGVQRSACSSPVTYTEDSTAPRTRVTMGPGVKTRKRNAVFRFKDVTADPPGTTFVCKVDKAKWKHCASPFHAKHLKLGSHTIRIRATDLAGNVEPHPVKRTFRVVPPA